MTINNGHGQSLTADGIYLHKFNLASVTARSHASSRVPSNRSLYTKVGSLYESELLIDCSQISPSQTISNIPRHLTWLKQNFKTGGEVFRYDTPTLNHFLHMDIHFGSLEDEEDNDIL